MFVFAYYIITTLPCIDALPVRPANCDKLYNVFGFNIMTRFTISSNPNPKQFWVSYLMKYGYKKWVTFLPGLENLLTLTITNKSEADAVNIHSALLVNTSPTRKRKS